MDNKHKGQNNDLPKPKGNNSDDDIPLWLQGLSSNEDDETAPQKADDQDDNWMKEDNQNLVNLGGGQDDQNKENDLEDSLPDWISELSQEETIDHLSDSEEASDQHPVEDIAENITEPAEQDGFVEISDISLKTEPSPVVDLNIKISEEEDLPDWLRDMLTEHNEDLTGDTEPVDFQGTEHSYSGEKIDQVIEDDHKQNEPMGDMVDEQIEEALLEEETRIEIDEKPLDKEPDEKSVEGLSEQESGWIEETLVEEEPIEELDEVLLEQESEQFEEVPTEIESVEDIVEETGAEKSGELVELALDDEPVNTFGEEITDEFSEVEIIEDFVEINQPEEIEEPESETSKESTLENSNLDLLEEDDNSWKNETEYYHSHNQELLRISEEDTTPTRVSEIDSNDESQKADKNSLPFIPNILQRAKKHFEDGEIDKGLDIIDVYIEENAYLDEIRAWMEKLMSNGTNQNQRFLRSFGDLALQQGRPEEAFEAYSQAMKSLIK